MVRTTFAACALVVVAVIVGSNRLAAEPAAAQQGIYRISPGDVLDVIVWRNKDLTMPVTVRPDGWISFPFVNELYAAGMTPPELQKALEAAFAKSLPSPMVTVIVAKSVGFKVSILGKVRQPGRYDVDASTTVLDVLALAGGPTDYAESAEMYVLRRTAENAPYQKIGAQFASNASTDNTNVSVKPGDVIIVP